MSQVDVRREPGAILSKIHWFIVKVAGCRRRRHSSATQFFCSGGPRAGLERAFFFTKNTNTRLSGDLTRPCPKGMRIFFFYVEVYPFSRIIGFFFLADAGGK